MKDNNLGLLQKISQKQHDKEKQRCATYVCVQKKITTPSPSLATPILDLHLYR